MIEINQYLSNNAEYYYSISEIPELNTDSVYIYDVSCTGIPTVEKINQTTFKLSFNTQEPSFNSIIMLKINGVYGYDDWTDNMNGDENTLVIEIKFNITRTIEPFILRNTSNTARGIYLHYKRDAAEDLDMYISVGATEGTYTHFTWSRGSNKQYTLTIPANQNLYIYSTQMTSMGHYNGNNESDIDSNNSIGNFVNDVNFNGNFDGIEFDGNIYSLTNNHTSSTCLFYGLFEDCISLTSAPALPAINIGKGAYAKMFKGCTALTTAPALPSEGATNVSTVPSHCYYCMFEGCTSLTTPPTSLPAKIVNTWSYTNMFKGCSSMTSTPSLDFETVKSYSCAGMFKDCTSLTTMPIIDCELFDNSTRNYFAEMFAGCTSLTTIRELDFDYIGKCGYYGMFKGCTSLETIPNDMITTSAAIAVDSSCCAYMFNDCISLESIPGNLLRVTSFGETVIDVYRGMFKGCMSLSEIPIGFLPATTIRRGFYAEMFEDCKSLTTIPSNLLPASTLQYECYQRMFAGCTSLTTIPTGLLNASTLAINCYKSMFENCTGLYRVPQTLLSATTCAEGCYYAMFKGCRSLVTPPELRATQVADNCYREMFMNCASLTSVYCLAHTSPTTGRAVYTRFTRIMRSDSSTMVDNTYPVCPWDDIIDEEWHYECPVEATAYHGGPVVATGAFYSNNNIYVLPENAFTDWLYGVSSSGTVNLKFDSLTCQLFGWGYIRYPENKYGGRYFPANWSLVTIS